MPLAKCHRCDGTGRYIDYNPKSTGIYDWFYGCEGEEQVDVPFPDTLCKRYNENGSYTDQNPTRLYVYDWCDGCGGTGYS